MIDFLRSRMRTLQAGERILAEHRVRRHLRLQDISRDKSLPRLVRIAARICWWWQ